MTTKKITFAALRIIAIYWLILAINSLASTFISLAAISQPEMKGEISSTAVFYFSILSFSIYLLTAIILWVFANKLSTIIVGESDNKDNASTVTESGLQTILFSAIGLLLVFTALPELAGAMYKLHLFKEQYEYAPIFSGPESHQIVETILSLILGIILLFGAKGLSGFIVKIRSMS